MIIIYIVIIAIAAISLFVRFRNKNIKQHPAKQSDSTKDDIRLTGLKIIEGGYLGKAKVKLINEGKSNSFLRTYFTYQSGQKERSQGKCVVLVGADKSIVALRGPYDTVLPYTDVLASVDKGVDTKDAFMESMDIARDAVIPDGTYFLYLAEKIAS